MQDKETEELLKAAKRCDPDAFTELMQMHMKDMYRVAIAILMNDEDAADAIQDTILTCWEKIGSLRKDSYFKTWLTRILIHKCYDIRKSRMHVTRLEEYEEPIANDSYNIEWKEMLSVIEEKYRIVLMLFYGEGYHIEEIAQILKIPKSTVSTQLQRGREKLAKYYGISKKEKKHG